MEQYIVSARKYRPVTFDTVVGQLSLTTTLKNAITSGKLAHAYLFCGPRGVGKTTCARIFAKTINCLSPREDGESCGQCESCQAFDQGRSMNIHELDAASNNSVEDIRELIKQVQIPPQIGKYKVFIIDEVHMLSSAAFNAFLKTLEEPPSYVIFILATTEKHKILPTILSRCQVYDFSRMTIQGTVQHLQHVAQKEGYSVQEEALQLIAEKADGGMRDALSIFDQMVSFTGGELTYQKVCESLNVLSSEYYFRLVDHFLANQVEPCMLLLNEILMKGFDAGHFIAGLASHMRNLLVARDITTLPLLEVSERTSQQYQQQAQKCPQQFIYRAIRLCNDCDQAYRQSHNKRLQVEICLIQCAQLTLEQEDASAGRRPSRKLKPIFVQVCEQPQASVAAQQQHTVTPRTVQPAQQHVAPEQKPSQTKLRSMSFGQFGPTLRKTQEQNGDQQTEKTQQIVQQQPVTEESVRRAWFTFINGLSKDDKALSARMTQMTPILVSEDTFQVTVDNSQVAEMLASMQGRLLGSMRQVVGNSSLKIRIAVAEVSQVRTSFSKPDILKSMIQQNQAIDSLCKVFNLEFA